MAETDKEQKGKKAPKKKRWLKRLAIAVVVLALLLVGAYFFLTSSLFFNSMVVPRIEAQLGREVQVEVYSFSPFGRLRMEGVTLESNEKETEPALQLQDIEVRFKLLSVLSDLVQVDRLHLTGLDARVHRWSDGSVTGPFPQPKEGAEEKDEEPSGQSGAGKKLALSDVQIRDVGLTYVDHYGMPDEPRRVSIRDFSVTANALRLDRESQMDASFQMAVHNPQGSPAPVDLSGRMEMDLSIDPGSEYPPRMIKADAQLTQMEGRLGDQEYDELAANFTLEASRKDENTFSLDSLKLNMTRDQEAAGTLTASGNWNVATRAGKVQAEVDNIDSRLLNLLAAAHGYDFRESSVSGRLRANVSDGARLESLDLSANASKLSVRGPDLPEEGVPPMDISVLARIVSPEDNAEVLRVTELESNVSHVGGRKIASLTLNQAFELDAKTYAPKPESVGDQTLRLVLNELDVPLWSAAFMPAGTGMNFTGGKLSGDMVLGRAQAQTPTARLSGKLNATGLKGTVEKETFGPLTANGDLEVLADQDGRIQAPSAKLELSSGQGNLGTVTVKADIQTSTMNGNANLQVDQLDFLNVPFAAMADLRRQVRQGRLTASSDLTLSNGGKTIASQSTMRIPDLVLRPTPGQEGQDLRLPFEMETDQVVHTDTETIEIRKAEARVGSGQERGVLTASGTMRYGKSPGGDIEFKAESFRSGPFEPLFADQLGGIRLGQVVISGNGKLAFSQENGLDNADVTLKLADVQPSGGALNDGLPMPVNVETQLKAAALEGGNGFRVSTLRVVAARSDTEARVAEANLLSPLNIKAPDYTPDMSNLPEELLRIEIPGVDLREWAGLIPKETPLSLNQGRFMGSAVVGRASDKKNAFSARVSGETADFEGQYDGKRFGPMGVKTSANVTASQDGSAVIHQANITLIESGDNVGNLDIKGNLGKEDIDLTADIRSVNLRRVPVQQLEEALVDVSEAVLSAQLSVKRDKGGADVNGTLDIKPFTLQAGEANANALRMPVHVEMRNRYLEESKTLQVDRFDVGLGADRSAGELLFSGRYSSGERAGGEFNMEVKSLRLAAFSPFLGGLREKVRLDDARLTGEQSLTISGENMTSIQAKGNLKLSGLRPAKKPAAESTIVELMNDLQRRERRVDVKQAVLELKRGETSEKVTIDPGTIDLANAMDQGVMIHSERITLPPLLLYTGIESDSDVEPLSATDLQARVAGHDGGLKVSEMAMNLGGGQLSGKTVILRDGADGQAKMEWVDLEGQGIDIDHLLATVSPDKRGYLLGTAQFETTGFQRSERRRRGEPPFSGEFRARITDGEILNVPIVTAIASTTGLEELRRVIFERFDSHYVARGDGVHLEQFDIVGKLQKIRASGKVAWDRSVDIPIELALGGKLKEKVKERSYSKYLRETSDDYLRYPTPLKVGGTLSKPKVQLSFPTQGLIDLGLGILQDELREDDDDD